MKERKRIPETLITAALSLLFGFFLAAGAALNGGGYLGYGVEHYANDVFLDWTTPALYLSILLYSLLMFVLLWLLWRALDWIVAARAKKILEKNPLDPLGAGTVGTVEVKARWFVLTTLLLLLCWAPFLLALWPGIYNYDAHYQYEMLTTGSLQTHHPLLHTLVLDGFVLFGQHILGSANLGIALYIGVVMVCSALTFSWMLYTMAEEGAGKVLLFCSFLFLAINPALVIWLVSTNKDILFSIFLLLAAILLYRTSRFRKWELPRSGLDALGAVALNAPAINKLRIGSKVAVALFFLVLGILAFKTSAVYSFVVFLPAAAFLLRKHLRKRIMGILLSSTAFFIVVYVVVAQLIFQIPSGPWQALDALSIPRQQLARVWLQTEDADERTRFKQVFNESDLKLFELYDADDADASRKAFLTAFQENPQGLLTLYIGVGQRNPGAFLDAALLTSYEAWYPGAVTDGYVLEQYFAKPGIARSSYIDVNPFPPAEKAWILAGFGEWLQSFGLGNEGLDLLPVRMLCSPAVYMWILFTALARCMCVRNRRGGLVCTLLLVFGLTALLSPLVVMRYFFMIMIAAPLLFLILSSPSWRSAEDIKRQKLIEEENELLGELKYRYQDGDDIDDIDDESVVPQEVVYVAPITEQPPAPQQAPVQQVPVQQVPAQQAPAQQVPPQQIPVQQIAVQQIPVQQVPVQQVPVQQVPVQQVPVQQVPAQQAPAQHVPAQQPPAQQVPSQQIPAQQVQPNPPEPRPPSA